MGSPRASAAGRSERGSRALSNRWAAGALAFSLAVLCGCGDDGPKENSPRVDRFRYYYLDPYRPAFTLKGAPAAGGVFETVPQPGAAVQTFVARKPEGRTRVFVLGGSVAQLYDSDSSIEPTLREALGGTVPELEFEIINAGRSGYDSTRELRLVKDVLRRGADLIVLISVANEAQPVLPPRWLSRLASALRGVPVLGKLAERAALSRSAEDSPTTPDGMVAKFERTVRRMLAETRKRRVPLLLCTLPRNLRDMPPPGTLPLEDAAFFDAWLERESGRHERAAEGFGRFPDDAPGAPMARYYAAKSLWRVGRRADARRLFVSSHDSDLPVGRLNDSVRKIAEEDGAVLVDLEALFDRLSPDGVPGRDLFEDDVHWHRWLDPAVSWKIADAARRSGASGGMPRVASAESFSPSWLEKHEGLTRPGGGEASARNEAWRIFAYRMWEPFVKRDDALFSERALALLEAIHESDPELLEASYGFKTWLRAKLAENIWDRETADRLDSWWPVMLAHVGELFRRKGRHGLALSYLREALSLDPGLKEAERRGVVCLVALGEEKEARARMDALGLAKAERERLLRWGRVAKSAAVRKGREPLMGRKRVEAKLKELEQPSYGGTGDAEALLRRADGAEALIQRALTAWTAGSKEPAAKLIEEALALKPDSIGALMTRGAMLSHGGDHAGALRDYEGALRALERESSEPQAEARPWLWADVLSARGAAYSNLGRTREAIADLEKALEKAPSGWPRTRQVKDELSKLRKSPETGP